MGWGEKINEDICTVVGECVETLSFLLFVL